jgi:hypothetical protein
LLANIISGAKKTLGRLKRAIAPKVAKLKANPKNMAKIYNKLESELKDHAKLDSKPKAMFKDNSNSEREAKEKLLKPG